MAKCSDETHLIRDSIRSSLNESKPEVTSNVGTEAESGADKGCQCRHPYLIEPALLLYTISRLGLVTIASEFLKDYLLEKYLANCGMPVCNNNYTTAIENQVQSEAAKWVLYLNLSRNLPAIFATIIIVPCTDRIGRKPGIALPALGAAVYTLMYVLVSYLKLPLEFLFLGAILEGLTGSYNAVSGSCYAYVADVIHGEKRTWRFTVISMLLNASSGVFNILLGFLVESLGFQSTFLTILGLLLLDVVYITAIVPESRRRKNNISINNIMKSIKNCLKIYRQKREDPTARGQLILLIPALAICSISFLGRLEVDTLYVIGPPLSFDATLVGIFVGVRALSTSMGGLILTRVRQPFMGDAAIGLVSVVSAIASNVCFALAKTETFVWICESSQLYYPPNDNTIFIFFVDLRPLIQRRLES